MLLMAVKLISSALIILIVTEAAKRSNMLGAIIISLPLVSIISLIWLYIETKSTQKIADFSQNVFWLTIPSLIMFIVLPLLMKMKIIFPLALGISVLLTAAGYFAMALILTKFNIKI